MAEHDSRYATFPKEPGVEQVRWLIENAAAGQISIEEFVPALREAHEQAERAGHFKYRSREEGRLVWDVLWAMEYYSPDPAQEACPEEWNDAATVLQEAKRVARRLVYLADAPKPTCDPRFENFPKDIGIEQLRWYIRKTAEGVLTIREFLADFREVHERIERDRRPQYASKEEAQAIWDVLWASEYCSVDISKEESPEEWYIPEELLMVIKQSVKSWGANPGGNNLFPA